MEHNGKENDVYVVMSAKARVVSEAGLKRLVDAVKGSPNGVVFVGGGDDADCAYIQTSSSFSPAAAYAFSREKIFSPGGRYDPEMVVLENLAGRYSCVSLELADVYTRQEDADVVISEFAFMYECVCVCVCIAYIRGYIRMLMADVLISKYSWRYVSVSVSACVHVCVCVWLYACIRRR